MYSRVEDGKVVITVELTVSPDEKSGGYVVTENDGPDRSIQWGPMPHYLVDAFVAERGKHLATMIKTLTDQLLRRPLPYFVVDLGPGGQRVPW